MEKITSPLYLAAGSMVVHSVGLQVTAHNIANVSTANFDQQRATFVTGPAGNGVALEDVRKISSTSSSMEKRQLNTVDSYARGSGTELAKEFPCMITMQRGFEANAATIKTSHDMFQSLLNIIA